jgi:hypothetical protein
MEPSTGFAPVSTRLQGGGLSSRATTAEWRVVINYREPHLRVFTGDILYFDVGVQSLNGPLSPVLHRAHIENRTRSSALRGQGIHQYDAGKKLTVKRRRTILSVLPLHQGHIEV